MVETHGDQTPSALPPPVMPTLAQLIGRSARSYQRLARRALSLALALVILATLASLFQGLKLTVMLQGHAANLAAVAAAVAFILAFVVRLFRMLKRPERLWYDSRGVAEQIKSLAWAYAVGGSAPMMSAIQSSAVQTVAISTDQYEQALAKLLDEAGRRNVPLRRPQKGAVVKNVTEWMDSTRQKPLPERVRVYQEQRIADQERYYGERGDDYARTSRRWNVGLLLIEAGGVCAAGLRALNIIQVDLIGVAGTLAAAGTAWLQFNQFATLSNTYTAMQFKLSGCLTRSRRTTWTEDTWAAFVREVEDLLDQEHGSWRQTVENAQPPSGQALLP